MIIEPSNDNKMIFYFDHFLFSKATKASSSRKKRTRKRIFTLVSRLIKRRFSTASHSHRRQLARRRNVLLQRS
jgi:hypothetical protein